MFAKGKCRINWITWYSVTLHNSWFWWLFYNDGISQEFKLDFRIKRFILSCLSQSIDTIISTAMCQHSDTVQCNVIWRPNRTHTKRCYFNAPLYLTPPILTTSHSTQSPLYSSNKYSKICCSRLILHFGDMSLMVDSFTLWPFYLLDQL
jgi:hypothetical protein